MPQFLSPQVSPGGMQEFCKPAFRNSSPACSQSESVSVPCENPIYDPNPVDDLDFPDVDAFQEQACAESLSVRQPKCQNDVNPIVSGLGELYMSLRANHFVTHTILNHINEHMSDLLLNLKVEDLNKVQSSEKYFKRLGKQRTRHKLFKSRFGLQEAETVFISSSVDSSCPEPKVIKNTFQYFPIKHTLEALFSNDKFKNLFYSETANNSDGLVGSHRVISPLSFLFCFNSISWFRIMASSKSLQIQ